MPREESLTAPVLPVNGPSTAPVFSPARGVVTLGPSSASSASMATEGGIECVPAEIDKGGTGDPPLANPTTGTAGLLPPAAALDPAPPRNGDWQELEPTKCLVSVSPAAMDPLCAALRGTVAEPSASSGNSRSAMGLLVLEAGAERVACARPGVAAEWACDE